jgi:hypothetical protein
LTLSRIPDYFYQELLEVNTMSFPSLLLLAFIAGATIIIGLAVGRLKSFNPTARSALTMLATGILVFLLVDILGSAMGQATSALPKNAPEGAALVTLIVVGGRSQWPRSVCPS